MNRLFSKGIWLLLIITISTLSAQEKSISLDDINEGVFRAEYLSALRSMIEKVKIPRLMYMTIKRGIRLGLY